MSGAINTLRSWIADSQNIVFFGGAGVSTESGIPDFRSADGLYNQQYDYPPETILSHTFFMRKPEEFFRFYRNKMLFPDAQPNAAHRALAALERAGEKRPGIVGPLRDYARYAHRHESPDALVALIPASERRIGILVEAGEPLADLWLRHGRGTVVVPYPRTVTAERLAEEGVRTLIVKDNGLPRHFGTDEWLPALLRQTGMELVSTTTATTYMQKGPEEWRLLVAPRIRGI